MPTTFGHKCAQFGHTFCAQTVPASAQFGNKSSLELKLNISSGRIINDAIARILSGS